MQELNREKLIFDEALEITSPDQRADFLQQACAGDAALLQRVHALLRASEAPAAFLPGRPTAPLRASGAANAEAPGAVIGRYKLLEQIGEGGFGIVYMADQLEPVRRRVALKIIKPGMDSRQVIGRFEAERQALALMDHPNIAKVLDGGTTEEKPGITSQESGSDAASTPSASALLTPDTRLLTPAPGRPYFVMELVNGIPLTKFCEQHQLDLKSRLELFIEVCSAVQHAHQKGIIHRDLKPSNILVTMHGERPVPKVIDFGIAKATREPLTDKTVFTQFQQFLGTPAYMSPEQAALSGLDVDTRSDIYSLGVLLYELLTGSPPFDSKELLSAGLDEMRRIIREHEPERPSTRLTRLHRANASQLPLDTRHSPLSRELDLIVLKALEKDRDRRYATANGLAADLRRFLNEEPVSAVAPTLAYQGLKLYRRNRTLVVAAAAFALLLLVATVVSTGLAIRAHRAELAAMEQATTAHNVNEFLWKELLKRLTPWSHTNATISLREAFELAAGNIDKRLAQQPLAEASVRFSFGKTYLGLFEIEAAETNLLRALALRRAHGGPPDERMADTLFQLGSLREFQSRWKDAAEFYEEAASIRTALLGADDRDSVSAVAKAAIVRARLMPPDEAEPLLARTLERTRLINGPEHHVSRAVLLQLGELWLERGELDRAGTLFEESYRLVVEEEGVFSLGAISALHLLTVTRLKQERFADAAPVVLKLAAATRVNLPANEPAVAQTIRALLAAWEAKGGGPEFEEFRRRAEAYLPAVIPRE